jgi:hypothetical protein
VATEVEIRNAIVARIVEVTNGFTPKPTVIGRDILDIFSTGWMSVLRDETDLIHGWSVTQNGAALLSPRQGGAEYELVFSVWQWTQYESGSHAQNSEDRSSAEREAVIEGFRYSGLLAPTLSEAQPLDFPSGSIATVEADFTGQVRVAKGLLRVGKTYGCS